MEKLTKKLKRKTRNRAMSLRTFELVGTLLLTIISILFVIGAIQLIIK